MGASYRVSPKLKQALVKLSALPHDEQDEVAAQIMARVAGDEWTAPVSRATSRVASLGDTLDRLLPKHPLARAITMTMGSFILFVQAPMGILMVLTMVVSMIVQEFAPSSGRVRQVTEVTANGVSRSVVRSHPPADDPAADPDAGPAEVR